MNFHIWNMFSKLKNSQLVKKPVIFQKKKKICAQILNILWDEGFILGYQTSKKNSELFEVFLKYNSNVPSISVIKSVSKPGKRIYFSAKQLWKKDSNLGLLILSTNKGIISLQQCKKLNIGGEPLVFVC